MAAKYTDDADTVLHPISQSSSTPTTTIATSFNLNWLKHKPRLCINVNISQWTMSANNEYILVCTSNSLQLLNAEGRVVLNVEHDLYEIHDICWSSYSNQFFILSEDILHRLDISLPTRPQLSQVKKFKHASTTFSTFDDRFNISSDGKGSVVQVYSLTDWKLQLTFHPPVSCKPEQEICKIRFNSDGTRLGLILSEYKNNCWFELRRSDNMKLLKTVSFTDKYYHNLLPLPKGEFLIVPWDNKKLYLVDLNGKLKQTLEYTVEKIMHAALLNNTCLILQVTPAKSQERLQLRFHDL
jgi:hypothetical protein